MRAIILPVVALGALSLAACGDRTAEAESSLAEAEVQTELPEELVSDDELQALADRAVAGASSSTVPTDPSIGAGTPPATGTTETTGTAGTTDGSTTPPAQ